MKFNLQRSIYRWCRCEDGSTLRPLRRVVLDEESTILICAKMGQSTDCDLQMCRWVNS